jgi:CubicO group peptidase (beta-lactamase class C family)
MKTFRVPGLSVAIVTDGRVVMAKGYGVRRLRRDRELRADAYATFWLNHDGSIARLRLVSSSPLVDFSFDFQDLDLRPVRPDSQAKP